MPSGRLITAELLASPECAFVAIDPINGSNSNFGFGPTKEDAFDGGPIQSFEGNSGLWSRIHGQRINQLIVNLYCPDGDVPETDSVIPPNDLTVRGLRGIRPNGITIVGEPRVLATLTLTAGTAPFANDNNKCIVEASGMSGSWTSNGGERLTSLYDTRGARFLRKQGSNLTAPILTDEGSKKASIGYSNNANPAIAFSNGSTLRGDPFVEGDIVDVLAMPIVPDVSPGNIPMSFQDIEISNTSRSEYVQSYGSLNMLNVGVTSKTFLYGVNGMQWTGCLFADAVGMQGCPSVGASQLALLGNGVVSFDPLHFATGSCYLGIADYVAQGAVSYFAAGSLIRAHGQARVFDLDAADLLGYSIGAFSVDGPSRAALAWEFCRGAIGFAPWVAISNCMGTFNGVKADHWLGTNTFEIASTPVDWVALAESGLGFTSGVFADLPWFAPDDNAPAFINFGF